jgi:hypothetical protein
MSNTYAFEHRRLSSNSAIANTSWLHSQLQRVAIDHDKVERTQDTEMAEVTGQDIKSAPSRAGSLTE